LEPSLVLAVLLSALLHALWNSFVKVGQDRLVSVAVICATGGVLSAPVALMMPLPGLAGFGFALLSVTTHVAYYFCLVNAYRFGDLSRVYPLARGLAPPLVAIGAALVAGERLDVHEVLGVALVSFGIASLVVGARGGAERRGLWFAAATGATIGIYTIIDGLGGRSVPRALSYIAWLNMFEGAAVLIAARARRGPAVWSAMRVALPKGVVAGVMATVGYGIVIYAMSRGAMAHVSALARNQRRHRRAHRHHRPRRARLRHPRRRRHRGRRRRGRPELLIGRSAGLRARWGRRRQPEESSRRIVPVERGPPCPPPPSGRRRECSRHSPTME
jgi:drug/metabolite transporter (DMT)-like permease